MYLGPSPRWTLFSKCSWSFSDCFPQLSCPPLVLGLASWAGTGVKSKWSWKWGRVWWLLLRAGSGGSCRCLLPAGSVQSCGSWLLWNLRAERGSGEAASWGGKRVSSPGAGRSGSPEDKADPSPSWGFRLLRSPVTASQSCQYSLLYSMPSCSIFHQKIKENNKSVGSVAFLAAEA